MNDIKIQDASVKDILESMMILKELYDNTDNQDDADKINHVYKLLHGEASLCIDQYKNFVDGDILNLVVKGNERIF